MATPIRSERKNGRSNAGITFFTAGPGVIMQTCLINVCKSKLRGKRESPNSPDDKKWQVQFVLGRNVRRINGKYPIVLICYCFNPGYVVH